MIPVPGVRVAAIALVFLVTSCREVAGIVEGGRQASPRTIVPGVRVTASATVSVVTLVLDAHGDDVRVGSYTGVLLFDPAALSYLGDVEFSDGALRAANAGAGELRVAGASATGFDRARLASYRFAVRDPAINPRLRFMLGELHEVTRTDLKLSIQSGTTPGASP